MRGKKATAWRERCVKQDKSLEEYGPTVIEKVIIFN